VLRVAAIQAEARLGEIEVNLEAAAKWTRTAAQKGARLVVFPEAFTTGYDAGAFKNTAPSADDHEWLGPLQELVDQTNAVVVLNTPLKRSSSMGLVDLVLSPGERPRDAYTKQHLHPPLEPELFTAGNHGSSVTVNGIEVGLSICYDANFPEHAAAAANDGAIAYVNSGAYFPGGEHRRDLHYASRALDNGMYVIFSGLVGQPHDFAGGSAAYDPLGRVIQRLGTEEGMVLVDIDPSVVESARKEQQMWKDRRADLGSRVRHLVAGAG
jgi:predicted amidohydrolase